MKTILEWKTGRTAAPRKAIRALIAFGVLVAAPRPAPAQTQQELLKESREAMESNDPFMGDYQGIWKRMNRTSPTIVAQVIPLGKERYHANILEAFDKDLPPIATLEGEREGDEVRFYGWGDVSEYCGPDWEAVLRDGRMTGKVPSRHGGTFELRKVIRLSPTLGRKPPSGAIVLFDGTNMDEWEGRRIGLISLDNKIVDGVMEINRSGGSISSKRKFTHLQLHVEFQLPYKPEGREQGRGNSGVFVHRQEVQVLDCYGLKPRAKGGGGIYPRHDPILNLCAPPMQWQTYDIVVPAPKEGENAGMTVRHNGVVIHDGLDLGANLQPNSIMLQDHGNPVRYRNIWVQELP